jgi:BirA family biotin operon repressor/biotin-[acetyl-CoA-carboxylase] ligase
MSGIGTWTRDWARAQGVPCDYRPSASSTNDLAKEDFAKTSGLLAAHGAGSAHSTGPGHSPGPDTAGASEAPVPLALYVVDAQTHGRGRGGSTWLNAAPGTALLSTWSFRLPLPPQPILSPLIGLALWRSLSCAFPGLRLALKAPNDILLEGKKLAGILIEAVEVGRARRAAIGIGLNALSAPEIAQGASSAASLAEAGAGVDRGSWLRFLDALLPALRQAAFDGQRPELLKKDREALCEALNQNPMLAAPVLGVDPLGQLALTSGLVRWQDL